MTIIIFYSVEWTIREILTMKEQVVVVTLSQRDILDEGRLVDNLIPFESDRRTFVDC